MKIIYETQDGGVAVVTPFSDKDLTTLANKVVPQGTSYEIVNDNVIPTNQRFRDAWQKSGTTVVVDITKAKDIALAQLRTAAIRLIEACRLKEELGEVMSYTCAQIQVAYQDYIEQLNSKVNTTDLETCLDQFNTTYDLEGGS